MFLRFKIEMGLYNKQASGSCVMSLTSAPLFSDSGRMSVQMLRSAA